MNYTIESFELKVLHRSHSVDRNPLGFVARLRDEAGHEVTVTRLLNEINWVITPSTENPGDRLFISRALKNDSPIVAELNRLAAEAEGGAQ